MNITSAKFNNNFIQQKTSSSPIDKSIGVFEKQKNRLQEAIKKIDETDDDLETKKKKKDELQKQIEELDKQIAEMNFEKLKEPPKTIVTLTSPPPEAKENEEFLAQVPLAESRHFLSATSNYSQMKTLGKARIDKLAEARIAIANGANSEEAMASVRILDRKIYEKAGQIQKTLKQSAAEIAKNHAEQKEVQGKNQKEKQEEESENSSKGINTVSNEVKKTTDWKEENPDITSSEFNQLQEYAVIPGQIPAPKPGKINVNL